MSFEEAQVQQGQILAGKYRVEQVLGQGGMGVVLAARHVNLGERVAVKLMRHWAAAHPEAVARFVREARAAARLESAHVARVSDVGILDDLRPYMVMEYLDGMDLERLLESTGQLDPRDTVDYVLQAAEALAEAHSLGIVHRDLKPSNLFLTRRRDRTPHVKVLDFGISKVAETSLPGGDHVTTTSALMGSPLYMSPEQMMSSRDVDGRSDIWSLGVVMYELLSGSPPFVAPTLPQVCSLVLQSTPAPLRSRRADVPVALAAVVERCLAKSPSARYQSIAELAVALEPLAGPYGRASAERISLLSGAGAPEAPIRSERMGRAGWPVLIGALGVASLAGAVAVWWTRSQDQSAAAGLVAETAKARPPPPLEQSAAAPSIELAPAPSLLLAPAPSLLLAPAPSLRVAPSTPAPRSSVTKPSAARSSTPSTPSAFPTDRTAPRVFGGRL
jgi:eukaryotic-like serine/threonine-protein kinase